MATSLSTARRREPGDREGKDDVLIYVQHVAGSIRPDGSSLLREFDEDGNYVNERELDPTEVAFLIIAGQGEPGEYSFTIPRGGWSTRFKVTVAISEGDDA